MNKYYDTASGQNYFKESKTKPNKGKQNKRTEIIFEESEYLKPVHQSITKKRFAIDRTRHAIKKNR